MTAQERAAERDRIRAHCRTVADREAAQRHRSPVCAGVIVYQDHARCVAGPDRCLCECHDPADVTDGAWVGER